MIVIARCVSGADLREAELKIRRLIDDISMKIMLFGISGSLRIDLPDTVDFEEFRRRLAACSLIDGGKIWKSGPIDI